MGEGDHAVHVAEADCAEARQRTGRQRVAVAVELRELRECGARQQHGQQQAGRKAGS
jgi:hypothetical protein